MNLYGRIGTPGCRSKTVLLEQGRFDALDVGHLVEELELMAGSTRGELVNRLIVPHHLLKLHVAARYLPMDLQRAGRGWRQTCRTRRVRLMRVLQRNRVCTSGCLPMCGAYEVAVLEAAQALGLEGRHLPAQCPWTAERILD
jgi:hypothetical protein